MTEERQNPSVVFSQTANPNDFIGLGIKNALLGFITLTLYRFWGRTEVRQRIWSTSQMNGEAFEYTGTGGELFKGFLIATAIFTLPYLLIIFGSQFLGPIFAVIVLLIYMVAVLVLIGAAIWLALRYLASRTNWRGIRFVLGGNPLNFSLTYLKNTFLYIITLGWWSPKFEVRIASELWGNLKFGDIGFGFDESKINFGSLYKKFALAWALIIIFDIIFMTMFGTILTENIDPNADPEQLGAVFANILKMYLALFGLIFVIMIAFMPYRAEVLRQIARATKMGDAEFDLDIDWKSFTLLYISNIAIIIFSLGFLLPVAQVRAAKYLLNNLKAYGEVNLEKASQAEKGPDQAEGLSDALDIGII